MSQESIRDSVEKERDSDLDEDDVLTTEGKLEPRRAHPYHRSLESSPPQAFPSQSLSAVIRGGFEMFLSRVISSNPLFK